MKFFARIFALVILPLIVTSCGGGGGSDSKPTVVENNPPPVIVCPSASTTDRYAGTSYDSCKASTNDLTGVWIVLADYSVVGNGREKSFRQRSIMTITTNTDGSLTAHTCNSNSSQRQVVFAAGANSLQIFDRSAGTPIQLSITSNTAMQGTHISSGPIVVQRSTVLAKKIRNLSSSVAGEFDLTYSLNGSASTQTNIPVSCFTQSEGTVNLLNAPVNFEGELTYFYAAVNHNDANENVDVSVFLPVDTNDDTDVSLKFLTSNFDLEGEAPANSVSPSARVTMTINDKDSLSFYASFSDEINFASGADFSFVFTL